MISIVLPLYNSSEFLVKRIDTILFQTYSDFELIVLDDNSIDDTLDIICSIKDSRIKVIQKSNINSGSPFGQWEVGFNLASGDLIWIAEADDFCEPTFLEKVVKAFEDPEVVISHCKSFDFRSESNFKENQWWDSFEEHIWNENYIMDGKEILFRFGRFKCPIINVSSAIFRKSILADIEIPNTYKFCGDWWFWAQVFCKGKVSFISEPLNYIRIHDNSATAFNNLDLTLRAVEATFISNKACVLSNTKFKYSVHYNWLVDFWCLALLNRKDFYTIRKLRNLLPISFWNSVIKKIFSHYKKQVLF